MVRHDEPWIFAKNCLSDYMRNKGAACLNRLGPPGHRTLLTNLVCRGSNDWNFLFS